MAHSPRHHEAQSRRSCSSTLPLYVPVSKTEGRADSRMLYHASYILLHRPVFDSSEILNAAGHVSTCLEHSAMANMLAVSFTSTFGERMTYVAMYSSFVAAYVVFVCESHVWS